MGWCRKPTDWIPKIPFQAPAGQPHHSPEPRPAQDTKAIKKSGENPWDSQKTVPCVNKQICGYTPHPCHAACVKASRWLPARVHNARRSGRMVHTLSSCLPTQDDTPVTPRRGPRSAMAQGKGAKRGSSTPQPWKSQKPPPQPYFSKNNQIPVIQPEDGLPRQKEHLISPVGQFYRAGSLPGFAGRIRTLLVLRTQYHHARIL